MGQMLLPDPVVDAAVEPDYDYKAKATQLARGGSQVDIRLDDLESEEIAEFLQQHIVDMKAVSPPESKHALDLEGLRAPDITFWTIYEDGQLVGCSALKEIDSCQGEVKSMRVHTSARGTGIGSALVNHIVEVARKRRYHTLKLETGSMAFFEPARNLYLKHGFSYCGPFGDYTQDPHSVFMVLHLDHYSV